MKKLLAAMCVMMCLGCGTDRLPGIQTITEDTEIHCNQTKTTEYDNYPDGILYRTITYVDVNLVSVTHLVQDVENVYEIENEIQYIENHSNVTQTFIAGQTRIICSEHLTYANEETEHWHSEQNYSNNQLIVR